MAWQHRHNEIAVKGYNLGLFNMEQGILSVTSICLAVYLNVCQRHLALLHDFYPPLGQTASFICSFYNALLAKLCPASFQSSPPFDQLLF